MSLEVGSRLGHYQVTALIGEGGMGQVYQATDTKLNRRVALKILPEAFASDPDRLARFQREAQVLASLNHPGIAAIYGIEEAGETQALVLELVEGPTLADRIAKGPIPVDEALRIAKQIAEALEAAHEAGVIHRDLKPANIKVREDGTVKVLDFGLAKALDTAPEGDPSQSPTLTAAATQMGVIMGTAAYMSPEQARGKAVDKRADIWAFGVVLYEILTGQRPFQGEDVSLTLASVMKSDVNVAVLPTDLPETLRTVIRRCLQKDPRQRIRDVGDVRLAMEGAFGPLAAALPRETRAMSSQSWQLLLAAAAFGALATLLGAMTFGAATGSAPPRVARFTLATPDGLGLLQTTHDIAITPDGTVVYRAPGPGPATNSWVTRSVGDLDAVPITGLTGPGTAPFVSPDGTWVGVYDAAAGELKKAPLLGGPPQPICRLSGLPRGVSWGDDGYLVFGDSGSGGLLRVSADGGEPQRITNILGDTSHGWPDVLPGARAVLFTILTGSLDTAQVAVLDRDSGEQRVLVRGHAARYAATGHVVYAAAGSLYAVGFDLDSLVTTSAPVQLVDDVLTKASGAAEFALARDGTLAYVSGDVGQGTMSSLVWVDRQGRESPLDVPPRNYRWPRLSPDDQEVSVVVRAGTQENLWLHNVERGTLEPLTFGERNRWPVWSPDGRRIVFQSTRGGGTGDLYGLAADRSREAEVLVEGDKLMAPGSFSADGQLFAFYELERGTSRDIRVIPPGGEPTPAVATPFDERAPAFSPDGRWLAYVSDETGRDEVWMQPYPAAGGRRLVSTDGGTGPMWSRDGRELFYRSPAGDMMTVAVQLGLALDVGRPVRLFEGDLFLGPLGSAEYDVTSDGQRFLMIKPLTPTDVGQSEPQLTLVLNWTRELLERVPVP